MKMMAAVMRAKVKPGPDAESPLMTIETTCAFPHCALATDEATIRGGHMDSRGPKRDIPRFIALYQRPGPPVRRPRNAFVTFDQIKDVTDKLSDAAVPRQVPRPRA